ncbi:MAG: hypothetical protein AAGB05_10460, partial [Pseudomonadota bacterium]
GHHLVTADVAAQGLHCFTRPGECLCSGGGGGDRTRQYTRPGVFSCGSGALLHRHAAGSRRVHRSRGPSGEWPLAARVARLRPSV